jgi:hypothetical protein
VKLKFYKVMEDKSDEAKTKVGEMEHRKYLGKLYQIKQNETPYQDNRKQINLVNKCKDRWLQKKMG